MAPVVVYVGLGTDGVADLQVDDRVYSNRDRVQGQDLGGKRQYGRLSIVVQPGLPLVMAGELKLRVLAYTLKQSSQMIVARLTERLRLRLINDFGHCMMTETIVHTVHFPLSAPVTIQISKPLMIIYI